MRILQSDTANMTGSLLVALPSLLDPNFRRSILFIVRHEPSEGAMGVILNRPTDSLLPDMDRETPPELDRVPVYEGGPVERQQLILARMITVGEGAEFEALGRSDATGHLPEGELRAFVGYAGWNCGQLEREITEGSWVLIPPTGELLESVTSTESGDALWRGLMRRLGPRQYLASLAPDDPSQN